MRPTQNRSNLLLLPFALAGFALAQPVYNLLLATPVFLLARQNTAADVWALTSVLSLLIPLALALPGWLAWRRWPLYASLWCWAVSSVFIALFAAQLLQSSLGDHWLLFIGLTAATGCTLAWLLLFTRWQTLTLVLAAVAVLFPLWFLFGARATEQVDTFAALSPEHQATGKPLPDIVFIILDELPLATLLNSDLQIDQELFPGFARLQSISNWYVNTTSVSDGTADAVPSILTGRFAGEEDSELTVAEHPFNLFTMLGQRYRYNVAETVTRLCPTSLCPRSGPGMGTRFKALLLDLTAIYLHRITPDRWIAQLPVVTNNWSGFFAERQVFFPDGWLEYAGQQTTIDRPGYFRRFIASIQKGERPGLNFMHILFPHEPLAYLPDGENYGLQWLRGLHKQQWGDVEWSIVSGKQRHFLQTQYADRLLGSLLDHLQQQDMLDDSMIVVVADHGINFALNDRRRGLTDNNAAAMLRVPLLIKFPGQHTGRRQTNPAMTIDILPTLLATLGITSQSLQADGIDLQSSAALIPRSRIANSYLHRQLEVLDESRLKLAPLVAENRTQLKLDNNTGALWQIGPYDEYRGQDMQVVCKESVTGVEAHLDGFSKLPNTRPEQTIRAFVAGAFSGEEVPASSTPFLITSQGRIVASGDTWLFNDRWLFFALVEPGYVRQADWAPKAWLVDGQRCLGK